MYCISSQDPVALCGFPFRTWGARTRPARLFFFARRASGPCFRCCLEQLRRVFPCAHCVFHSFYWLGTFCESLGSASLEITSSLRMSRATLVLAGVDRHRYCTACPSIAAAPGLLSSSATCHCTRVMYHAAGSCLTAANPPAQSNCLRAGRATLACRAVPFWCTYSTVMTCAEVGRARK